MTLLGFLLVAVVLAWRRIERWGYLKMGEAYEREEARRRERRVGIPYDPNARGGR